jgi:hypothetical protein
MRKLVSSLATAGALALVVAAGAVAASGGYTLFGDAQIVSPGNASANAAEATSTGTLGYGGVDLDVPAGLTVNDLDNLATDYRFAAGTCGLGSPRFSVDITNGTTSGNLVFYIGPPPNYTGCPPAMWANSGNLASPANLVDSTHLPGGTFYDPYAAVQLKYGAYTVTGIALIVDGPGQTVQFDNTQINDTTVTYEPPPTKDDCKNGGWENLTDDQGNHFRNQGDCVSFFATQK